MSLSMLVVGCPLLLLVGWLLLGGASRCVLVRVVACVRLLLCVVGWRRVCVLLFVAVRCRL